MGPESNSWYVKIKKSKKGIYTQTQRQASPTERRAEIKVTHHKQEMPGTIRN